MAIANKIKDDLGEIGVEVTVMSAPFSDYEARIQAGRYDMFLGEVKIGEDMVLSMFAGRTHATASTRASE